MRYVFTRRLPETESILLVESGSRHLLEGVVRSLRNNWGNEVAIDLVTCYSGLPEGFPPESTKVYRVNDYRGRKGRAELYRALAARRYSLVGIICSDEPVLTRWKWGLALLLRAKAFIINENGDYFWVDRGHLKPIREFVLERSGLAGAGAVRMLARAVVFPFTFLYLLLYAGTVHARRTLRRG